GGSRGKQGFPRVKAQGIERCPAEAEVACSNHAGRISAWTPVATDQAFERARPARAPSGVFERGFRIDPELVAVVDAHGRERPGELDDLLEHGFVAYACCGCRGLPDEISGAGVSAV